MSLKTAGPQVAKFLLEHSDLADELVDAIDSGVSKESLRAAIRAFKVKISDEAVKEELGLE